MTRAQREILVERYLAGEMSASEEQEFFMGVATDGDLLQLLRAHRMVERALDKDRDAIPAGYLAIQERAMAMLAMQSPALPAALGTASAMFSGFRLGTWIAIISTALVFSVGGFITRGLVDSSARDVARPAQPTAGVTHQPTNAITPPAPPAQVAGSSGSSIHDRSRSSSITELTSPNTSRKPEQALHIKNSDSSGEQVRYDSGVSAHRQTPAEHRSDTLRAASAPAEELSKLPHDRDSIPFRMHIVLPQKPNLKKQ